MRHFVSPGEARKAIRVHYSPAAAVQRVRAPTSESTSHPFLGLKPNHLYWYPAKVAEHDQLVEEGECLETNWKAGCLALSGARSVKDLLVVWLKAKYLRLVGRVLTKASGCEHRAGDHEDHLL